VALKLLPHVSNPATHPFRHRLVESWKQFAHRDFKNGFIGKSDSEGRRCLRAFVARNLPLTQVSDKLRKIPLCESAATPVRSQVVLHVR
jgi:hypothetical protein